MGLSTNFKVRVVKCSSDTKQNKNVPRKDDSRGCYSIFQNGHYFSRNEGK